MSARLWSQDDVERALARAHGAALDLSAVPGLDLNAAALVLVHAASGRPWTPPAAAAPRSWLRRIGFEAALGGPPPGDDPSDVLLEFTRIEGDSSVAALLERVGRQASHLLRRDLRYTDADVARFTVALSELCHNIPEHAQSQGWAGIHRYRFRGRAIVKIAVVDTGIGARGSLAGKLEPGSDLEAIEAAFLRNVSRHDDPGRGHGLREVRRLAERWGGKVTLRSGTAKLASVPEGMTGYARASGLAPLPGLQVLMSFPELG